MFPFILMAGRCKFQSLMNTRPSTCLGNRQPRVAPSSCLVLWGLKDSVPARQVKAKRIYGNCIQVATLRVTAKCELTGMARGWDLEHSKSDGGEKSRFSVWKKMKANRGCLLRQDKAPDTPQNASRCSSWRFYHGPRRTSTLISSKKPQEYQSWSLFAGGMSLKKTRGVLNSAEVSSTVIGTSVYCVSNLCKRVLWMLTYAYRGVLSQEPSFNVRLPEAGLFGQMEQSAQSAPCCITVEADGRCRLWCWNQLQFFFLRCINALVLLPPRSCWDSRLTGLVGLFHPPPARSRRLFVVRTVCWGDVAPVSASW